MQVVKYDEARKAAEQAGKISSEAANQAAVS